MATYKITVNTARGKLNTTFTNRAAARDFEIAAGREYGWSNVQGDDFGSTSYANADKALADLRDFGAPLTS